MCGMHCVFVGSGVVTSADWVRALGFGGRALSEIAGSQVHVSLLLDQ